MRAPARYPAPPREFRARYHGQRHPRATPMEDSTPRIEQAGVPDAPGQPCACCRSLDGGPPGRPRHGGLWSANCALRAARPAVSGAASAWDLREARPDGPHRARSCCGTPGAASGPPRCSRLPDQRAMLERVARYTVPPRRRAAPVGLAALPGALGRRVLRAMGRHVRDLMRLMGQLLLDLAAAGARAAPTAPGATCRATCTASAPRRCRSRRWWVS